MLTKIKGWIFRTKPSTGEVLEQLEKDINKLEEYKRSTEQKQKHLLGSLLFYSSVLYLFSAIFFYLFYLPSNFREGFIYSIPLVGFPLLIWLVKRFLQWNFRRKIEYNDSQLDDLKRKRKALLEEVREKETYKVATALLEKYDPEYKAKQSQQKVVMATPQAGSPDTELRRRSVSSRGMAIPQTPVYPAQRHSLPNPQLPPGTNQKNMPRRMIPPALPRPVLPRERSVADRLIDYLVGDGPSNRYALICQQCYSHNGMALKEEFEYLSFRCCYCLYLNPARKQRPKAPKLEEAGSQSSTESAQLDAASSEASDGTEEEIVEEVSGRSESAVREGSESPVQKQEEAGGDTACKEEREEEDTSNSTPVSANGSAAAIDAERTENEKKE